MLARANGGRLCFGAGEALGTAVLGFTPISSRPISGSPFNLVLIAASMSASIGLSLAITARIGAFTQIQASVGVTFSGSPALFVNQALGSSVSLAFSGTSTLYIAGKPIRFNALPESFESRAMKENWTLKALSQSFNVRAAR
jgi:hypothetical protein